MGRRSSEFGVPAMDSQIDVKNMAVDPAAQPEHFGEQQSHQCFSRSLRMIQSCYETKIPCFRSTRFYPFYCNGKKP
jgi:hypothetical protein